MRTILEAAAAYEDSGNDSNQLRVSVSVTILIAELAAGEAERLRLKMLGSIRISYIKITVLEHF